LHGESGIGKSFLISHALSIQKEFEKVISLSPTDLANIKNQEKFEII
jgi:ABC-type lipoprotein export system ATPase subunit